MPQYINAEQAADYFAELRRELPKDAKDFFARDSVLLNTEQLLRLTHCLKPWDSVIIGDCDGCAYKEKRWQKCSCCRRNRNIKDCYKEET